MEILSKISQFRLPKRLQAETLRFLVTSINTAGLNVQQLREIFRELDIDNSGTLTLPEMRQAFEALNLSADDVNLLFDAIDFNHDGEINYTEFLTVTVDKRKAITEHNLLFAFHHFDVDNTGVITHDNLVECFRREGKHLNDEEIDQLLEEVQPKTTGQVTFEEFRAYMNDLILRESSPLLRKK